MNYKKLMALAVCFCLVVTVATSAVAAVTVTRRFSTVVGDMQATGFTITFDSSYPTGGEALTKATLGFGSIQFFGVEGDPTNGYVPVYDHTNSKFKMFVSGGNEVANTTDLSTSVVRIFVIGW